MRNFRIQTRDQLLAVVSVEIPRVEFSGFEMRLIAANISLRAQLAACEASNEYWQKQAERNWKLYCQADRQL